MASTFGDYKPVGGLIFAHSIQQQAKGSPGPAQVMTIEKIEVNPDLADSRFAMPAAAKPRTEPPGGPRGGPPGGGDRI